MSEDYVNQLTLNFLISKTQLAKLNKKISQDSKNVFDENNERFRKDIVQLFNKLLENDVPSDLLQDVRDSFDHFIDKSIYYLKVREDNNKHHQNNDESSFKEDEDDVEEDETSVKDEDEDETSFKEDDDDETSFKEDDDDETSFKEEEDEDEDEEETMIQDDEEEDESEEEPNVVKVHKKFTKTTMVSNGVDDIQKLPLDWFNNIRQNYKKTQILTRKKELIIPNDKLPSKKEKI